MRVKGAHPLFLLLFILLFISGFVNAQSKNELPKEYYGADANKIIPGASYVQEGIKSTYPAFVRFETNQQVPVQSFLPWLKKNLKMQASSLMLG